MRYTHLLEEKHMTQGETETKYKIGIIEVTFKDFGEEQDKHVESIVTELGRPIPTRQGAVTRTYEIVVPIKSENVWVIKFRKNPAVISAHRVRY